MHSMAPRHLRLAMGLAAIALIATAVVIGAWTSSHLPTTSPSTPSSATAIATPAPARTTAQATTSVVSAPRSGARASCRAEIGPLPSALSSDPCPAAILAVELAVATVRLPIERIVVEPGSFSCGLYWPGAQTPPACYGAMTRPGQYMHAWVSFVGSSEVAVVVLGLNLPSDLDAPGATRPPWQTTVLAVEVPPSGWVMP